MAFLTEPSSGPEMPGAALVRLGVTAGDLRAMAPWFDDAFYRRAYPLLDIAEGHALAHYLEQGWKLGHDPSAAFSTDFYLSANPDVKAKGIIPLLHFVRSGRAEGRPHRFVGAWRARLLASGEGLEARVRQWKRPQPQQLLALSQLEAALAAHLGDRGAMAVVIALLQDRYQDNVGGVQACAQEEQRQLNGNGHAYIAISPYQASPGLDRGDADAWLGDVSIDGQWVATARGGDLLDALARPHR